MGIDHQQLATHAFAIINPLQVDRSQWSDLPNITLTPPALSAKPDAMPVLIDLARLDETQCVAMLTRAEAWEKNYDAPFVSLLLKTDATSERLAAHLTGQLLVNAPDSAKTLLRWYDPRVFQHLRWLLTDVQLRRLGGPSTAWTWRDTARCWRTHELRAGVDTDTRLRLTVEQWAVIGRMGVLNRTVVQLRRNAPEIGLGDDVFRSIDALLKAAYDIHGLTEEADVRLFAEQGIRYHPGIHGHRDVARGLEQARAQETTYVDACIDLDHAAFSNWTPQRTSDERNRPHEL